MGEREEDDRDGREKDGKRDRCGRERKIERERTRERQICVGERRESERDGRERTRVKIERETGCERER